mgnify:CR=1 FL=1
MTSTIDARKDARDNGTYDVYIDIDIDCEELLDACDLDYTTSEDDESQNEVKIILNKDEFCDVFETVQLAIANEQVFASRILNPELGEYTTKLTVYTPSGDVIMFK